MPAPLSAQEIDDFNEMCAFKHLALNGRSLINAKNPTANEELNGVEMPVYLGYYIEISDAKTFEVKQLKFVAASNTVPVKWVEKLFDKLEENQAIYPIDDYAYPISHPQFMRLVTDALAENGVYRIMSEVYSYKPFPDKPRLGPDDFEYKNTCIYRPFDDPPEFCENLKIELANDPAYR